jgi:hypothetical protein
MATIGLKLDAEEISDQIYNYLEFSSFHKPLRSSGKGNVTLIKAIYQPGVMAVHTVITLNCPAV